MNLGVHPFILIAAVGVFFALVAGAFAYMARSGGIRALMIIVALVCMIPAVFVFLAFHPELVDGRFRTYKDFYSDIQIGMTKEEVLGLRDRRYPEGGTRKRPRVMDDTSESLGFFMNPESSREPNCEGIFLKLENGKVKSKTYSPD